MTLNSHNIFEKELWKSLSSESPGHLRGGLVTSVPVQAPGVAVSILRVLLSNEMRLPRQDLLGERKLANLSEKSLELKTHFSMGFY